MLYICATPIGNLNDISLRAIAVLKTATIILCEDTRHSNIFLKAHNIENKKLIALHEHNENEVSLKVIEWLKLNHIIVQISDAGTPAISDPGARLCNKVLGAGFKVSPLPGPCAFTALLSVSGVSSPTLFYGFLPHTSSQRKKVLQQWQDSSFAICCYEAPHRIIECITDIISILGDSRIIVMGREMTKQFETIKKLTAAQLLDFISNDANQQRGEFALIIEPSALRADDLISAQQTYALEQMLIELPPKKAVNLNHKLFGGNKDKLYQLALKYKAN
ncbi:MAG: rRNA ((1402)-2-O)-methyltransferase [Pseudomonadota bacterium]|jgi:16S rRNA (cytidine1402-2'-O)-methyltransferase|nr:16S rRNA (cytidine(1402)-2'-O)-methyltransferase [Burkholderiales bacterium]